MSDDLHQTSSGKRLDVISWDEFFMSVAIAAQRRSKDPNTQVGGGTDFSVAFVPPTPSPLRAAGFTVDTVQLGQTPQRQRVVYR